MTELSVSQTGDLASDSVDSMMNSGATANDSMPDGDDDFEPPPSKGLFISSRGYVYRDGLLLQDRLSRTEHRLLGFLITLKGRVGDFA